MARRPKRTYNQETGKWEVERLWDSRDAQGRYWKDGVEVDQKGFALGPGGMRKVTPKKVTPKKVTPVDDRDTDGDGVVSPEEREAAWAKNPKNPKSVNHPDYVAPGGTFQDIDPNKDTVEDASVSTPGTGVGGGDVPEVGDQSISADDPRNIIMGESSIDLMTGDPNDQASNEIAMGDEPLGTYTPGDPSDPQGVDEPGSILTRGKSGAKSIGGGYGKRRVADYSRKQMNLTSGRQRSLLTSNSPI